MKNKISKATAFEMQASIFGASIIAFGLGIILADFLKNFAYLLVVIGVVLHALGMYRINKRNS